MPSTGTRVESAKSKLPWFDVPERVVGYDAADDPRVDKRQGNGKEGDQGDVVDLTSNNSYNDNDNINFCNPCLVRHKLRRWYDGPKRFGAGILFGQRSHVRQS